MQKTSKLARDGAIWGLIMVAPTIIGLLVLNIYPFIETIYMSFSKSKPFGMFEFEGIDNYVEMFQNAEFWKATWNTILFCILTVPVGIFLALLVAVLLNSKIRGRTTFRAIFFPWWWPPPPWPWSGSGFSTPSMVSLTRCWAPTSAG